MITKRKSKKASPATDAPRVVAQQETKAPVTAVTLPAGPGAQTATPTAPAESPATIISVKVDVGFGNKLFVRGAGRGLSWDKGLPMECVADNFWTVALKGVTEPVVFKVLVNDVTWSVGEDYTVAPGQSVTLTPEF